MDSILIWLESLLFSEECFISVLNDEKIDPDLKTDILQHISEEKQKIEAGLIASIINNKNFTEKDAYEFIENFQEKLRMDTSVKNIGISPLGKIFLDEIIIAIEKKICNDLQNKKQYAEKKPTYCAQLAHILQKVKKMADTSED
jgi:hypothetical protein